MNHVIGDGVSHRLTQFAWYPFKLFLIHRFFLIKIEQPRTSSEIMDTNASDRKAKGLQHLLQPRDAAGASEEIDDHVLSEEEVGPNLLRWNAVKDGLRGHTKRWKPAPLAWMLTNTLKAVPTKQRRLVSKIRPGTDDASGSQVIRVAEHEADVYVHSVSSKAQSLTQNRSLCLQSILYDQIVI